MAGLLDYIEAPFHAIGGLFGGGGGAPAPAPQPTAPPAEPYGQAGPSSPQGYVPPPVMPKRGVLGDVLDSTLLGGALQHHAAQEQARQMAIYQGQRLNQIYGSLPDDQKPAFILDPVGYTAEIEKGIGPQTVKDTERLIRNPLSGGNVDAQHLGVTPQGATFTQGQSGPTMNTGGPGSIITAPVTDSVTQYTPPTSPGIGPHGGPPVGAPMLGAAQPPVAAPGAVPPAGPQSGPPRGIRNNNPGNVRALPNGQMWQGQTGVDPAGYAVFATPQDGVHATLTNLHSYGSKDGVNTPQGLARRWAPQAAGNNTANYADYIAKTLGVKPTDKIDLTDAATQGKAAQAIFEFENGLKPGAAAPTGMAGPGPSPQPPQIGARGVPAQAPSGSPVKTLIPGKTAQILPPNDPRLQQFPPGAVVEQAPDGSLTVKQEGYSPTVLNTIREGITKSKQYDEYTQGNDAYKAMISAARLNPGGMRAYALRDTFARVINPGAVARVGTIQAIKEAQGVPASVQAFFMNLKGYGDVPPAIAQQILDVAQGFARSHYGSAKALNDANVSLYQPKGIDPASVTAPLEDEPARYVLGAGPVLDPARAAKLHSGETFVGLDGKKRTRK